MVRHDDPLPRSGRYAPSAGQPRKPGHFPCRKPGHFPCRLTDHADVFVQSLRAGVVESLGFDYESVEARRPEIIYVSVTAYGQAGPLKNLPGYDPLMQAQSGIMSVTGHPETGPARVGVSVVDFGTGMWAAVGALAALHERAKTGRGCHVTTALLDTALGWISYHVIGHWASGVVPEPMGSQFGMIAPYGAFPTEDGQLMIAAGNDASFGRLCIALGLRELVDDPRYSSNPSRVENRDDLFRVVARVTHRHTTSGLLEPPRTTCRSCGAHPRRGRSRCRPAGSSVGHAPSCRPSRDPRLSGRGYPRSLGRRASATSKSTAAGGRAHTRGLGRVRLRA